MHRPIFTIRPQNTTVKVGDTAILNCKVLSDNLAHVAWYKVHSISGEMAEEVKSNPYDDKNLVKVH